VAYRADSPAADRIFASVVDDRAEKFALAACFHVGHGHFKETCSAARKRARFYLALDLLFNFERKPSVSSSCASLNSLSEIGAAYLVTCRFRRSRRA
jgi:hypothetical protein